MVGDLIIDAVLMVKCSIILDIFYGVRKDKAIVWYTLFFLFILIYFDGFGMQEDSKKEFFFFKDT